MAIRQSWFEGVEIGSKADDEPAVVGQCQLRVWRLAPLLEYVGGDRSTTFRRLHAS